MVQHGVNLENIMLRERSHSFRTTWNVQSRESIQTDWWLLRAGRFGGKWGVTANENTLKLIVEIVLVYSTL